MTASTSVDEYLAGLGPDRRSAVTRLRGVIRDNLPPGFKEVMANNMPSYVVPLETYPDGYHVGENIPLPFVSFASQKGHLALYHFGMYVDRELLAWFEKEYARQAENKLDMGKSCVRFKNLEKIPYSLIGELMQQRSVGDWISRYVEVRPK